MYIIHMGSTWEQFRDEELYPNVCDYWQFNIEGKSAQELYDELQEDDELHYLENVIRVAPWDSQISLFMQILRNQFSEEILQHIDGWLHLYLSYARCYHRKNENDFSPYDGYNLAYSLAQLIAEACRHITDEYKIGTLIKVLTPTVDDHGFWGIDWHYIISRYLSADLATDLPLSTFVFEEE